ncbi:cell wall protein IFF6-like [Acyrthosiphon pisum]|uniref:Uncharacterized protein n=1 Tax=Acyrthosiphon pisum TaxID=7029 RepID=A0A8R2D4N7_ACYPI|nr:cell wall protein IFF6-like [Acyrthosiphon pisum]|eukprot:XP_016659877.1 PREDICTED: uncharacterized transmembrane protein DDB_G0289901-like [Acyrthosiphon pisum]
MIVFWQAMSDHFDHYKRPPSRDNSVDRYSRAASRLSGGSRQSSVEKSQNQQQQRRGGDDRLPSSSSSTADKSFSGGAGFNAASAAGAKQNISSSVATQRQPPPFEDIILRQRNLGQEIVPSPIGQPKRTESLYVNPNTARKETKPKVSTTYIRPRSRSNSPDNGDDQSINGGSVGSVGSGGSDDSHGSRRGSIIGCCCFLCNRSDMSHDNSEIIDSQGRQVMRGNSDFRTNNSSTSDGNGRGSGDGHAIMDSFNFSEIGGSGDGRVSRISGYIHSSRGRGVGRSRSNSTDNYGSRVSGDGFDSMLSADEHANMISGGDRPSRCNESRGSSRGRGEGRSSSRSSDGRATSSTIPLNSSNGHSSGNNTSGNSASGNSASGNSASGYSTSGNSASGNSASGYSATGNSASGYNASGYNASGYSASGNSASGNSSITYHRRSRSGLRVRFSDEVSSSDDPPGRGSGPNRDHNHIRSNRHSSCDSYFDSRDSNQVITREFIQGNTGEFENTINLQVSTYGNYGNIGGYSSGSIRNNFDDHSNIARVHRVGGYESGGVCCSSNDDYVSNGIRDVSVVHGRGSIRSNGGGHINNNIRGVNGVYVSSRVVRDRANHHVRGVVIREISNSGRDSGQGTDDYECNYDYEGFYNYADGYVNEGNYGNGDGGDLDDGRIRRLLPSIPFIEQMMWFRSYLRNSRKNILFYHT